MQDQTIWAVSPLDGRYAKSLDGLSEMVSEGALIGFRLEVELAWLKHLAEVPSIVRDMGDHSATQTLTKELLSGGLTKAAANVKEIERKTNHDVKACEYYLRESLKKAGAPDSLLAFIHFACTSEDINNLAYGLMTKTVRSKRLLPAMDQVIDLISQRAESDAAVPMLSRTHGQTASPTTMGKEMAVFAHRLWRQRELFAGVPILGKINGAVGNFNAHVVAYPDVNWPEVARDFVEKRLGLAYNPLTTQIENHDAFSEYVQVAARFNTIAIGFARDVWSYISLGYFKQKVVAGEVGSSTMPHKVNPIDFENAEGNFGLANALSDHFASKLPISRWQRDLSDSTVLRSFGSFVGYSDLGYRSLAKGMGKLVIDRDAVKKDLMHAAEVLAEPVQTVMRQYGIADAYERLKEKTRGQSVSPEALASLIDQTRELPQAVKERLKLLTPESYCGIAESLALEFVQKWKRRLER